MLTKMSSNPLVSYEKADSGEKKRTKEKDRICLSEGLGRRRIDRRSSIGLFVSRSSEEDVKVVRVLI